jgi:hypothetical protein
MMWKDSGVVIRARVRLLDGGWEWSHYDNEYERSQGMPSNGSCTTAIRMLPAPETHLFYRWFRQMNIVDETSTLLMSKDMELVR